ncbi:hypothetical protein NE237_028304 [Protea cynaroides]|uniref:Uncharacterized protein n=1 Tax=Protea cynaroides TaxID=273540 RepID=A0A9Q0GP29_9MAGN|nr:hypothetical protein NE237_028304 [Protea cynaroides]
MSPKGARKTVKKPTVPVEKKITKGARKTVKKAIVPVFFDINNGKGARKTVKKPTAPVVNQKNKRRAVQPKIEKPIPPVGRKNIRRACRDIPISYTCDAYDNSVNEAIEVINGEPTVRRRHQGHVEEDLDIIQGELNMNIIQEEENMDSDHDSFTDENHLGGPNNGNRGNFDDDKGEVIDGDNSGVCC